jgi:hypothetical protein
MKTWTIDSVLAAQPCPDYTLERVTALAQGREWTTREIIDRRDIPAGDRVWLACQPGAITLEQRKRWLEVIVTRAIKRHVLHCGVAERREMLRNIAREHMDAIMRAGLEARDE